MSPLLPEPLTDEQRNIGYVAIVIQQDSERLQSLLYARLREIERHQAERSNLRRERLERELAELEDRVAALVRVREAIDAAPVRHYRPSRGMPQDTFWQRLRGAVWDYYATEF